MISIRSFNFGNQPLMLVHRAAQFAINLPIPHTTYDSQPVEQAILEAHACGLISTQEEIRLRISHVKSHSAL